jgi:hypothetical protein
MSLTAQIRTNQLERNHAIDEHVTSAVDHAHATFTEQRFEAVAPGYYLAKVLVLLRATGGTLVRGHVDSKAPLLVHAERTS